MVRKLITIAGTFCFVVLLSTWALGFQPPEKVTLRLHFRIQAFGVERLKQISDMLIFLKKAGFTPNSPDVFDELQDEKTNYFEGTIAKGKEAKCVDTRWIQSGISWEEGMEPPFGGQNPVRIDLRFSQPMSPQQQKIYYFALLEKMKGIGYQDAIGYSHLNYSRLTGNLPGINLIRLNSQLIPQVFRSTNKLLRETPRVIRVLGEMALTKQRPELPKVKEELKKFSPTARQWLEKNLEGETSALWNVTINPHPAPEQLVNQFSGSLPDADIEGRNGGLLQFRAKAQGIINIASHPAVLFVTQAEASQRGKSSFMPGEFETLFKPGQAEIVPQFNFLQGIYPIAVIGSDFTGWKKALPSSNYSIRFLDFTQTRSIDFSGPQFDDQGEAPGVDTSIAKKVADECAGREILLVRTDPSAVIMLDEIADLAGAGNERMPSLIRRHEETQIMGKALETAYQLLLEERKKLLDDFSDDPESEKKRKDFKVRFDSWNNYNQRFNGRNHRMIQFQEDLKVLKKCRTFLLCFQPPEILPYRQDSPVSLFSDVAKFKSGLWFIPPKESIRKEEWKGPVLDADGNGWLEFQNSPPQNAWENERLKIVLREGKKDILANQQKLRVRLRWREPVDSIVFAASGAKVTSPEANFNLVLLKKESQPGLKSDDEFTLIAETGPTPYCIFHSKNMAIFEHWLDLALPGDGNYYFAIAGKDRGGEYHGSVLRKRQTEIYPEIFLDSPDLALARGKAQ